MSLPGPVRVAVIDIAAPLADLDCTRAGAPYIAAWILVCRGGYPLGSVELPVTASVIEAAVLERELRARLGADWTRTAPPAPAELPRASVVVPTAVGRPEQLQRSIARLVAMDHPDFEVIVVDNRAAGEPIAFAGTTVVREPRPGISAARNRGLEDVTGAIVAFTDDDVEVDPQWLRRLSERFVREPSLSAVSGLVVPAELETSAQVLFERSGSGLDRSYRPLTFERAGRFGLRRRCEDGSETTGSIYQTGELGLGSNFAFRTDVLRSTGGFDLALGVGTPTHGGEDLAALMELIMDGHRVGYEPSAIVHHTHRATIDGLERQLHGYGVGFTAMLTALAIRDPRHVAGLASVVPLWLRTVLQPADGKHAARGDDYPVGLAHTERRGMLAGPGAYLKARRMQRAWAR